MNKKYLTLYYTGSFLTFGFLIFSLIYQLTAKNTFGVIFNFTDFYKRRFADHLYHLATAIFISN